MIKFLNNKLFRYLSVFLFLNSSILPIKSSSALAAWAINSNGVLELRTKSNTNLKDKNEEKLPLQKCQINLRL